MISAQTTIDSADPLKTDRRYLALGDSISIDFYTGVAGGGAASQFARLLGAAKFENMTFDGATSEDVLEMLPVVTIQPDVITLTIGGNDFLEGLSHLRSGAVTIDDVIGLSLSNIDMICLKLQRHSCPTIINTIYDPTDGDDALAAAIGIPPELRIGFNALNQGIKDTAQRYGYILSDLETVFRGHGAASMQPWIVSQIEPNLAGATAIAAHWDKLLAGSEA